MDKIPKERRAYIVILFLIFALSLSLIAIYSMKTDKVNISEGDILEKDIKATKDLEDSYTTELIKKEAASRVQDKFRQDPSIQIGVKNELNSFFSEIRDITVMEDLTINSKVNILYEKSPYELDKSQIRLLAMMESRKLNSLESYISDLSMNVLAKGVKESDLEYEINKLNGLLNHLDLSDGEKEVGYIILKSGIKVNEFLDKEETNRLKEEASSKVQPLIVKENETIAKKGSVIGKREMFLIAESGLMETNSRLINKSLIGALVLIMVYAMSIGLYIYNFNVEVLKNNKILVIMIISLIVILISKALYGISPYILPVSSAVILISILVDLRLGLYFNVFISVFLGYVLKMDINIIIMYILGGAIGALVKVKQEERYNIFYNGLVVGVFNLLLIIGFGMSKGSETMEILNRGFYGFLSGLISSVIALGTLPIWENVFKILTPLKLLELSNPNKPLLKKLMMETPGTYHHSILVGNLAEGAAEAIGADSLLSRVGAYYHDIGKTKNPLYFAENQFGIDNPHDRLSPVDSARIIINHTKDGIILGKKEGLPKEILDLIEQHHGGSTVAYFKHKAKEMGMEVDDSVFVYPGKSPQTKEAAILTLADSCEAAVRSLKELDEEKIENMVRKVVGGNLKGDKLLDSDLTFKDVEVIIDSFINTLTGIYHDRIEYPEEEEEGKEDGSTN